MRRFKGSPLPWRIDCDNYHGYGVIDYDGNEVFELPAECERDDKNASFIGAASEVLSALQRLVEVHDSEDGKQWTASSKREALAKAREAINLALGED